MIKIIKIPIKPTQKQQQEQKIVSQFHYIKELSLMKYDAEEKREQNLIQQSSQMQTAFSFMTAAIFMALPICIEFRGVLSLNFFLVSTSIISAFLIASLILASLAQWRWKTESLPDIEVIKDAILNNEKWESLCIEHFQIAQFIDLISRVQDHKAHLNNRRAKLIVASMITFYLSVSSIIISFIVAIICML